jgi:hypothetical protein
MCGEFESKYLDEISAMGLSKYEEVKADKVKMESRVEISVNGTRKQIGANIKSGDICLRVL